MLLLVDEPWPMIAFAMEWEASSGEVTTSSPLSSLLVGLLLLTIGLPLALDFKRISSSQQDRHRTASRRENPLPFNVFRVGTVFTAVGGLALLVAVVGFAKHH